METTIIRNWQNAAYLWDRRVSMTTFSFVFFFESRNDGQKLVFSVVIRSVFGFG